jgi:uncharacterized membrane protein
MPKHREVDTSRIRQKRRGWQKLFLVVCGMGIVICTCLGTAAADFEAFYAYIIGAVSSLLGGYFVMEGLEP